MKVNIFRWKSVSIIALITAVLFTSMPIINVSASSSVYFTEDSNAGYPATNYAGRVIVGDFDSDGDTDILYQAGAAGAAIKYARSNGDGTFTEMDQTSSPFSGITIANLLTADTAVADFDGDGYEDVWIRTNNSKGIYFKNEGNGIYSNVPSPGFPTVPYAGRVVIGDFDADGDTDVLYQTGASGTAIKYARSNGDGTFTEMDQSSSPFSGVTIIDLLTANTSVADFDGDGYEDVWIRTNNSKGIYFKNAGNGIYSNVPSPDFPSVPYAGRVVVGDFDTDGDTDVLYQTGASGTAIKYARSNGDGTFTEMDQSSSPFSGITIANLLTADTAVADFDGDTDQDLWIRSNSSKGIYLKQNISPPFLIATTPANHAINVSPTSNIELTFTESVTKGTGKIYIINLSTNVVIEQIDVSSSQVSGSGVNWTIDPSVAFVSGESYALYTNKGVFKDNDGMIFAGIPINKKLKFTINAAATDTMAPVLSDIESSNVTLTTATLSATSDEAGTMYYVVTTSSTAPSAAQVIAGQDHTGAAAFKSGSGAATADTAKDFNVTGLAAGTQYYVYFAAVDASNNASGVDSTGFTTSIDTSPWIYYLSSDGSSTTNDTEDALKRIKPDGSDESSIAGNIAIMPGDLTLDIASGKAYFFAGAAGESAIKSIDLTTGAVSVVKSLSQQPAYAGIQYDPSSGYIYYLSSDGSSTTNGTEDALKRIKPDGSDESSIAGNIAIMPGDLTLDIASGKAYFFAGAAGEKAIKSVDLTTGAVSVVKSLSQQPAYAGIQYDPSSGYIYYLSSDGSSTTNGTEDALKRIKPDGSDESSIAGNIAIMPGDLTLDVASGKAYFFAGAAGEKAIKSVDLTTGAVSIVKSLSQQPAYAGLVMGGAQALQFDPVSSSPQHNGSNVDQNSNISLTFNHKVLKGVAGHFTIKDVTAGTTIATIANNSAQITGWETDTLTIDPSSALPGGHNIAVQWDNAIVQDYYNSFIQANTSNTTYVFTTSGAAQNAAPTVSTYSPADDATGVDVNANLALTFSENVTAVSGKNIVIKQAWDDAVVETIATDDGDKVTIADDTVTIDPAATLLYGSEYYVQIDAGAFRDANDAEYAGIVDETTWNFKTEIQSTVTAADSNALQAYLGNENVSVINLQSSGSYEINGVAIDRELTVNGDGAEVGIAEGTDVTVISRDNTILLPTSYQGTGVFDILPTGILHLNDLTLRNGDNKIMVAINVQDGGQLVFDHSKLKDFFGDNDDNAPNRGVTYGIHSDPGSGSRVTITNSEFDGSNAFRDVIDIRGGQATIRDNTIMGTDFPEKLRISDRYEYGIYVYGGTSIIENNVIDGFDSHLTTNYSSSGIAGLGYYDVTLTVNGNTFKNNSVGFDITNHWVAVNEDAVVTVNGNAMNAVNSAGKAGYSVQTSNSFSDNYTNIYTELAFGTKPYTYMEPQLSMTSSGAASATLSFAAPGGNAGSVKVQQSIDGGDTWSDALTGELDGESTQAVVTGLSDSPSYLFRLVVDGGYYYGYSNFVPFLKGLTASAFTPSNGATGVGVNDNLTLTFSEDVTAVSGKNIAIKQAWDDVIVETIAADDEDKVTIADDTVTIDPAATLLYSSDYYVQIDAGAFKSTGNTDYAGIADETTWSFQTEIKAEVTAANSAELKSYFTNSYVDTINLVNGTSYQYDGGTIDRDLTVNGNGATIQAGSGIDDTVVRSDDITVDSSALGNYANVKTFLIVEGAGSELSLNGITLQSGTNPIFDVINVKTGGSLTLDGVTVKGFHNNPTPGNNLSFGIHAEPGAVSTKIVNSNFDSSNAFRNAIAIRSGLIEISGNSFEGTDYPERLRQSDGYEYAIYIYGGTGSITDNAITGYDSTTQQGYASAGISVIGFYSTNVTIEDNELTYNESGIDVTRTWTPWTSNLTMIVNGLSLTDTDSAYVIGEAIKVANTQDYVSVSLNQGDEVELTNSNSQVYYAVLGGYRSPYLTTSDLTSNSVKIQFPADAANTDVLNVAEAIGLEQQMDNETAWTAVTPTWTGVPTTVTLNLQAGHTYRFRAKLTHKSHVDGGDPIERTLITYSSPVSVTTAAVPTFSGVGSSNVTQTTATASATSDKDATMYYIVTTSSTAPSAAQVMAGEDHAGAAAFKAGSGAATAAVAKEFSVTGLAAGTQYYVYFVAKDSSNGVSTVGSATFTTDVPSIMGGTVAIDGAAKYGETLTANVSGVTYTPATNDDQPTYQWKRGGVAISGATNASYTLAQEDIGAVITVMVTADGNHATGNVTSTGTAAVAKANGPAAPAASTLASRTTTSITLTSAAGQEYSKDNGLTWQDSATFTGLTPSTDYTFVTRVKETATHAASTASAGATFMTDALPVMGGTVTIDGAAKYGETLAANLNSVTYTPATNDDQPTYQWKRGGVAISGATSASYTLAQADIGAVITVTVTADGNHATGNVTSAGTAAVAKADGPNAPAASTLASKTTTSITQTSAAGQEYSKDNGLTWQDSATFTGLTPSTDYTFVTRVKETATHAASAASAGATFTTDAELTYMIASIQDQHANALDQGYANGTQETLTISVTNSGTGVLENVSVSLSGTHDHAFDLTQPLATTLNSGDPATTFTVKAKDGLVAGTYTATVTISADNMTDLTFIVTQVVNLPNAPANPQNLTAAAGDRSVDLSWNAVSGATYYNVYMSEESDQYNNTPVATVTDATYKVQNLINGQTYYFVVRAGNLGGLGGESNEVSAIPATVPDAPTDVAATAGNGRATITFTAPLNDGGNIITAYEVYDAHNNLVGTGNSSPIIIAGLANGTAYTFTVKAKNAVGGSDSSAPSNAVTPMQPVNNDNGNSSTPSTPESASTGVDVLVNGKVEKAGTATTAEVNGQQVTTIAIDEVKLQQRLDAEGTGAIITIPVSTKSQVVVGELNGRMVKSMEQQQAVIEIRTEKATYTLPADQINIEALSERFGTNLDLQNIKVKIEIAEPQAATVRVVEDAANQGGFTLVVPPLNFKVSVVYGDRAEEVSKFNAYVKRTVAIPEGVDPNRITTGIVVEADGTVRHVPTKIAKIDGKYYAQINSLTNSTYSVVWHPIEFLDVENHWAKAAVNNMGSRMVVSGTGDDIFSPERDITRAEFAAIIVRGLGLRLENGESVFTDVKQTDWYSSAVQTAYEYGLIAGYEDGSFRPNDKITREQAMLIVSKAMKITGLSGKKAEQSANHVLEAFADANNVSNWSLNGVADSVSAGIISGRSNESLAPKAFITRAEVAMMMQRLLQKSDLINE
jgi:methionine-rich copper-binding protein CopC